MENNPNINKEDVLKKNQKQNIQNEKLAVKFPNWDLLPPALLVKRELKNEA